jgi:hypothetical protein
MNSCSPNGSLDGLWKLVDSDYLEKVYMELHIKDSKYYLYRDGLYLKELDVYIKRDTAFDSEGIFRIYINQTGNLIVLDNQGKREIYHKVEGNDCKFQPSEIMFRRFNFYINHIDATDTNEVNHLKEELWNYFHSDQLEQIEDFEIIKSP